MISDMAAPSETSPGSNMSSTACGCVTQLSRGCAERGRERRAPRASDLLHGALFRGRMIAKERLEAGENGLAVARLLAEVADEVVGALYDFTTIHVFRARNPTEGERLAVMAVGGYGRGELAPSSDLDLLFLRAYKQTPCAESVTEYMLYMLWDMGLKVGHASRNIDECMKLAREDHTIRTAFLEARCIAGDAVACAGTDRALPQGGGAARPRRIHRRQAEGARRAPQRVGASRYMVEPNIKEGKGGLRDLHTLFWLARHRYGFVDARRIMSTPACSRRKSASRSAARSNSSGPCAAICISSPAAPRSG